jgi:hypothetical protein
MLGMHLNLGSLSSSAPLDVSIQDIIADDYLLGLPAGLANYEWKVDGVTVQNGTSDQLDYSGFEWGTYVVTLIGTNSGGRTGETSIELGVGAFPTITQNVAAFELEASPEGMDDYEWFVDAVSVQTGTSRTLDYEGYSFGTYAVTVTVTQGLNTADSSEFTLTLVRRAIIDVVGWKELKGKVRHWPPDTTPNDYFNFKWYVDDVLELDQNTNSGGPHETYFDFLSVSLNEDGDDWLQWPSGTYSVRLEVRSPSAVLTQTTMSVTVLPPVLVTLSDNSAGTLTANVTGGDGVYEYLWEVDGSNDLGQTTASYDYSGLTPGSHNIRVQVSDSAGDVRWSDSVDVWTASALEVSISDDNAGTLTANVTGGASGSYTYQWYSNGDPVPGATASTYDYSGETPGTYEVFVRVGDGSTTVDSDVYELTVLEPLAVEIVAGAGETLVANASGGAGGYVYEWYVDGEHQPAQTTSTFDYSGLGTAFYTISVTVWSGSDYAQDAYDLSRLAYDRYIDAGHPAFAHAWSIGRRLRVAHTGTLAVANGNSNSETYDILAAANGDATLPTINSPNTEAWAASVADQIAGADSYASQLTASVRPKLINGSAWAATDAGGRPMLGFDGTRWMTASSVPLSFPTQVVTGGGYSIGFSIKTTHATAMNIFGLLGSPSISVMLNCTDNTTVNSSGRLRVGFGVSGSRNLLIHATPTGLSGGGSGQLNNGALHTVVISAFLTASSGTDNVRVCIDGGTPFSLGGLSGGTNSSLGSGAFSSANFPVMPYIGARNSAGTAVQPMTGQLGPIMLRAGTLTDAQLTAWHTLIGGAA